MDGPAAPDPRALDGARDGDKQALTALFRTLQPQLLRYLRGRLPDAAEDLAAHTWLDAVRNLHRFTGGSEDFRRWLFTIARRRVQDEVRRRVRRPEVATESPPEVATDDDLDVRDDLTRALALVRRLPDDQADAVLLRVVAGMDVSQVAEVMGRSEGSVRVLVHRGLHRLRDLIGAGSVDVGVTRGEPRSDEGDEMTESGDEQLRSIDEILAVLQSPARAGELDGEQELIDAMAAVVIAAHDLEPAPMHSRFRPLKLGVLAGAAAVSLAGVAAAAGVLPDRKPAPPTAPTIVVAPSAVTPHEDPTTIAVAAAAAAATPTVPATAADTPTTVLTDPVAAVAAAQTVSAPPCPPDVTNHGDYVSRVARDTPPGPDHGKIVAAAAQSDCGKPIAPSASEPAAAGRTGHGSSGHPDSGQGHSKRNNGGGQGQGHG